MESGLSNSLRCRKKQTEASHLGLGGYRIKEFLAAPIGPFALQWMLDAGARLRCDYSHYFQTNHLRVLKPSQRRPYLVGLTKEEALAHPGSYLANLFVYTEPRFHFSRSQRTLLEYALMGETCEALATSLSLSPWTVKKRWRAIYDRVSDVDQRLIATLDCLWCAPHHVARNADGSCLIICDNTLKNFVRLSGSRSVGVNALYPISLRRSRYLFWE